MDISLLEYIDLDSLKDQDVNGCKGNEMEQVAGGCHDCGLNFPACDCRNGWARHHNR